MDLHIAPGGHHDLPVVGGRGRGIALHHAGQVHILTAEDHLGAGFEPAGFVIDHQATVLGGDLQQAQTRIVLADGAVDDDVVDAADDDAAARVDRGELAGTEGFDAGLAMGHRRTGGNQDVALGGQITAQFKCVLCIDDDGGIAAARHQVARQHRMAGRVQVHAAIQGFQQTGGFQVDVLVASGVVAGVQVDALVTANPAGNGDFAAGSVGLADIDHRTAHRRVDGVTAPGLRRAVRQLAEAETFGMAAVHAFQGDVVIAAQHQVTVIQAHFDLGGVEMQRAAQGRAARRGDDREFGGLDGRQQVFLEEAEAVVGDRIGRAHGDHAAHGMGAQVDGELEGGVAGEMAVGEFREFRGDDFLGPGRGQHREVTGSGQGDAAELLPGFQVDVAADDDALVGPGVLRRGRADTTTAAHVDDLAGVEVAAETNLAIRLDDDAGVALEGAQGAAQITAHRIVVVQHLAARDQLAVDLGVLGRANDDGTRLVAGGDAGAARHLDADAVGIGAADELDALVGAQGAADFHQGAGFVRHHATEVKLPRRFHMDGRRLQGPGDGLRKELALGVEDLVHPAAGQDHAGNGDIADRVDVDLAAGIVAGDAGGGQTGRAADDDRVTAIVGAHRTGGFQADGLGRHQYGVDQDLLTRHDIDHGIRALPGDAGLADQAAGHHTTVEFHVAATGQIDGGAGAGGVEGRGGVHIEAEAVGIRPLEVEAIQRDTAQQGDVAGDVGLALPVDPAVGLDDEVGIRAQQVDVAADDGVVLTIDHKVGAVLQRGDGAGEQEAVTALTQQHVRRENPCLVDDTVVLGIVGIELVAVRTVIHHPADGIVGAGGTQSEGFVGVVHPFREGGAQGLVTGAGLVIDHAFVLAEAGLIQHPELLDRRVGVIRVIRVGEGRAVIGNRHIAPADLAVLVIDTGHQGELVLRAHFRFGVVVDDAIPALIAEHFQDAFLLLQGQVQECGVIRRRRDITPFQGGVVVVAIVTLHRHQDHLFVGGGVGVVEHLLVEDGVAQGIEDDVALRQSQALEGGIDGGRAHAAPVDRVEVEIGGGAVGETGHQVLAFGGVGLVPDLAFDHIKAEGAGHHGLLRRRQAGEGGVGRRRAGIAPEDVGIVVVGHRPLIEAGQQFRTGGRVVVEEVLRAAAAVQILDDDGLLLGAEVGPGGAGVRAMHAVGVAQFVPPEVARHAGVIEQIAQVRGNDHFLRASQAVEAGVGGGRGDTRGSPAHQGVAVVEVRPLQEVGTESTFRVEIEWAFIQGVTGIAGDQRSLGQGFAEGAGEAVVVAPVGIHGVPQRFGHPNLVRIGQVFERQVLGIRGNGGDRGGGVQVETGIAEQRAQLVTDGARAQGVEDGGDGDGIAGGREHLARQGVEILGEVVDRFARFHGQGAGGGNGTGQLQFAVGDDGSGGVEAGDHRDRRAADVVEAGAGGHGAAGVQMQVGGGGQRDRGVIVTRGNHRALQDGHAGTGTHAQRTAGAKRGNGSAADNGMAGLDIDPAAGIEALDQGTEVAGEAVDFLIAENAADAGT